MTEGSPLHERVRSARLDRRLAESVAAGERLRLGHRQQRWRARPDQPAHATSVAAMDDRRTGGINPQWNCVPGEGAPLTCRAATPSARHTAMSLFTWRGFTRRQGCATTEI